jgi:TPR repeat protein
MSNTFAMSAKVKGDMAALLLAVNTGDVDAAYELAELYRLGVGVEQSETYAVKWLRKAAEKDHSSAQCRLGFAYMDGKGVEKDYALAEKWFRKSAKNGNPVAEGFLETFFEKEGGLKRRKAPFVKELTETELKCLEILRFFRKRRYLEAFKILEGLEPEGVNGDDKNSVGNCDPTEAIHVGVDEEWNLHYEKAFILEREHELAQAIKEAKISALIALERLGPDHTDFAASLNLLSELYCGIKRFEMALAFVRRSLVIRFRNLGIWHSEVAECLHNIACINSNLRPNESPVSRLTCSALALRIRVKVFGKSHPAVALSLVRLGRAYRARYDFKPALKCVKKAIAIYEDTIGKEHLMTQRAIRSLASIKQTEERMNSIAKEG